MAANPTGISNGYQKVIATLNSGGTEAGIIVNSQVFLKGSEYPWQMLMDWGYILKETQKSELRVASVKLIPREPETLKGVRQTVLANEKYRVLANRKSLEANYASGYLQKTLLSESRGFSAKAASAAAEDAPITMAGRLGRC